MESPKRAHAESIIRSREYTTKRSASSERKKSRQPMQPVRLANAKGKKFGKLQRPLSRATWRQELKRTLQQRKIADVVETFQGLDIVDDAAAMQKASAVVDDGNWEEVLLERTVMVDGQEKKVAFATYQVRRQVSNSKDDDAERRGTLVDEHGTLGMEGLKIGEHGDRDVPDCRCSMDHRRN
jgi:hypothetical protein